MFLIVALSEFQLYSQDLIKKQMEVEMKIEKFISKNIKNYKLSNEKIANLKQRYTDECKTHAITYNAKAFNENVLEVMKNELRRNYFETHPKDLELFTTSKGDTNVVQQSCTDGGFETWPVSGNPFIFRKGQVGLNTSNMYTLGFTPFTVGTGVNLFNNWATLVSPGTDPQVGAVQRVNTGQRAVKLNIGQPDNSTSDVVTMSRTFVVNENFFDFSYNVVLNNPSTAAGLHTLNTKPIFLVRLYDVNNNIIRTVSVTTDPGDCQFSSSTNGNNDGTLLYSGWRCGRINTGSLISQTVTIEFVVGDCTGGRHYGTVYIDNICNNSCSSPLFGSINLNSIPSIQCPTTSQSICGTFQVPLNSQYTSMLLNVTQNGAIIGTVTAPSTINVAAGTYCFTVPISAFGASPTGNFEFQVIGNFTRICTNNYQLDPITDNSSNDTGPDVTFNAPITPTFNSIAAVCTGSSISPLPTTSTNGITGSWSPAINNAATTTYTFTPNANQCANTTTLTITINPKVTPTFTALAPICKGSALSALPTTSTNGITGTWSPALNNLATTTYTFTPTAGLCANTATMTIVVIPIVAVNDNFSNTPINTLLGGNTPTVFTNDTLNGVAVTSSTISASIVSSSPLITPAPTISSTGIITIPQGTTIGNYTIVYQITQVGCTANFTTASVTVVVNEQVIVTPTIVPGVRANNIVSLVDTQSDGKIIIVGYFTAYNNIACSNINRLNTDLTYDTSTGFVVSGPTPAMSIPLDMHVVKTPGADYNKILIAGNFTGFSGGTNCTGIVRLNSNGSIDTSFNAAYGGPNKGVSGSNSQVRTIFVFPTGHPLAGKILIGGMFTAYNNNPANRLALLNADGSFNTGAFNSNINTVINPAPLQAAPGFASAPQTIDVQSDGKIIIGGYFTWYNGLNKFNILRLNVDGTHDDTFNSTYTGVNPGIQPNAFGAFINKLVVQPDNKIIIAGEFTTYNNASSNNLARLNANGTLDTTFAIGTGFNNSVVNPGSLTNGLVRDLILDTASSNWKLYACGDFTGYQGAAVDEIIRINCTLNPGTNDIAGFTLAGGGPNGSANGYVWSIKKQNDGKIILGGKFTTYNSISSLNVTRILPAVGSNPAKQATTYYVSEPEIDIFNIKEVVVYPNPTSGIVTIKMPYQVSQKYICTIYNLLGQKIMEQNNVVDNTILDLSDLRKGTYIILFSSPTNKITKTILLE